MYSHSIMNMNFQSGTAISLESALTIVVVESADWVQFKPEWMCSLRYWVLQVVGGWSWSAGRKLWRYNTQISVHKMPYFVYISTIDVVHHLAAHATHIHQRPPKRLHYSWRARRDRSRNSHFARRITSQPQLLNTNIYNLLSNAHTYINRNFICVGIHIYNQSIHIVHPMHNQHH